MPELPEVETTRRALLPLVGKTLATFWVSDKTLRYNTTPEQRTQWQGQTLLSIQRRAKYLLWHFADAPPLVSHLGMSGRFSLAPHMPPQPRPHDHVILQFTDHTCAIYNDARRFGGCGTQLPQHLGPEPLEDTFTGALLWQQLQQVPRTAIKVALLNAAVVVGVGNIYASESLWRAKIWPFLPAGRLTLAQCNDLAHAIKDILTQAIAAGGSTLRDFAAPSGKGYFQFSFSVYDRQNLACPRCAQSIVRVVQQGRSTFYCLHCQQESPL